MGNSLSVKNIKFSYSNREVLSDITFEHRNNGIIALLGPNGAGKTTLMRILVGLKQADSGNVYFNEENLLNDHNKLIKIIGYLPQNFEIYSNVSGLDFLSYVCDMKMLNKEEKENNIEFVIQKFNLEKVIKKRFGSYSGGYKRRLGIAQAVIGNPKLIIIDEPTVGLDPEQRFEFRQYLTDIGQDKIVLISTHIVEDIAFYCNKVIVLNGGKITFDGTSKEIIKLVDGKIYSGTISVEEYTTFKEEFEIIDQSSMEDGKISLKIICEDKVPYGFLKTKPTLENAYVYFQKK